MGEGVKTKDFFYNIFNGKIQLKFYGKQALIVFVNFDEPEVKR
jgi:hypothetical protein